MELKGSRVLLRDLRAEDFDTAHAYGADVDVVQYMPWGPNSPEDTRAFLQRAMGEAAATPRTTFELAIIETGPDGGGHVGGCGLMGRRAQYHDEYEIGYCLCRKAWGRGLASEAVGLMLDFAFGAVGAHRIFASIDAHNKASQGVAQKHGFRLEGKMLRDTLIRGEWRDSFVYALVSDEYKGTG